MIYIGIVGSRKRSEYKKIYDIIKSFVNGGIDITIVSGGADGIDSDAELVAKKLGVPIIVYKPNRAEYSTKGNNIYFERNELIAKKSHFLYAFPLNRKGGTMNTVKYFTDIYGKNTTKLIIID